METELDEPPIRQKGEFSPCTSVLASKDTTSWTVVEAVYEFYKFIEQNSLFKVFDNKFILHVGSYMGNVR